MRAELFMREPAGAACARAGGLARDRPCPRTRPAPAPVDRERDCAARGLRARDRCGGRAAGRRITPAAEWFIDNYYVIEELAGDKLLPAVDVVGRAGQGRVGHDVYGERGDVGRSDDAPDGKRGAELIAAVFELIAGGRWRQRGVDGAGGDGVDPGGRGLARPVGCEGGECGRGWR